VLGHKTNNDGEPLITICVDTSWPMEQIHAKILQKKEYILRSIVINIHRNSEVIMRWTVSTKPTK